MIFLNLFILLNCLINLSITQELYEDQALFSKPYDFLLLELTWPVTFCLNMNCAKIPKNFCVHGMWPNRFDRRLVTYCGDYTAGENFEEQIRPMSQRLSEIWPALKRGDDIDFWKYQMNKHGYCFMPQKGARYYFETALKIHDNLNLENILTGLDYIPSTNRLYNSNKFLEDLRQAFGVYPSIKCNNRKNAPALLKNIDFCFDKKTFNLIDCQLGNKCKNSFIIPDNL